MYYIFVKLISVMHISYKFLPKWNSDEFYNYISETTISETFSFDVLLGLVEKVIFMNLCNNGVW